MAINLPNGLLKLLGIDPSTIEVSLSNAGNSYNGTNANEHIMGNGGGDSINAGGGSDIVEGGSGGDSLIGGAGIDTLGYSQSESSVTVTLNDSGGGATPALAPARATMRRAILSTVSRMSSVRVMPIRSRATIR